METAGVALSLLGQIEVTRQWAKSLKRRYQGMKMVPHLCANVDNRLRHAKEVLEGLEEDSSNQMSQTWKSYMKRMRISCESGKKTLKGLDARIKCFNTQRVLKKTKVLKIEPEVTEKLRRLQKELEDIKRDAMHLDGYKKIVEEVRNTHAKAQVHREEIFEEVGKAQAQTYALKKEIIEELRKTQLRHDGIYQPKYTVPPNQGGLLLDLNDETTLEGQLRQLVLKDETNLAGAVGSHSKSRVASVYGISGVGKTCAVKAVGNDKEV